MKTLVFAIFLFVGMTSVAKGATSKKAEPQIEVWSEWPTIETSLQLQQSKFKIKSDFRLDESIGFNNVKAFISRADLLKNDIRLVRAATYSAAEGKGNSILNLTLGRDNHYFKQSFHCHQTASKSAWVQDCVEQQNPIEKSLLVNAELTEECVAIKKLETPKNNFNANNKAIRCGFKITGQMLNIVEKPTPMEQMVDWPTTVIKGAHTAYRFFTQFTSYVEQMGILAGNNVTSPDKTKDCFDASLDSNKLFALQSHVDQLSQVAPEMTYIVMLDDDGDIKSYLAQLPPFSFHSETKLADAAFGSM